MASEAGVTIATLSLGFAYGEREVLCGVDLRAEPGEVVGLVGPNGSGKSTIVRILSGLLPGYRGSASVGGREVRQAARGELARVVAVVPQEPVFGFPFTALEVALMGRHPHLSGLALEGETDVSIARGALERCGVASLAHRAVQQLSSGERQRVVFAKALSQQPRALLLDEPASFLDIRHQVELYDLVRSLAHEEGRTVLTVLHDLNLAAEYCDRVYMLRAGRIDCNGKTEEVLTYPNLRRVFETEVYIDVNSLTGKLLIGPLPGRVSGRRQHDGEPPRRTPCA